MSTERTVSRGIRIKREIADYFKGKPLNRYIESLYEYIQSGEIEEEENGISLEVQNKGYIRELEIDCKLMGVEVEEFVKMVCRAIDEGEIVYEDGKLVKMA